jgi:hypothetical protein
MPSYGSSAEPQFEALQVQAGNVLAELRVTVCRMVQLLQVNPLLQVIGISAEQHTSPIPPSIIK